MVGKFWRLAILVSSLLLSQGVFALPLEDQQHLLGRLSFGVTAGSEIDLTKMNRAEAVAALLDTVDATIDVAPPGWLAYTFENIDNKLPLSNEALRKFKNNRNKLRREHRQELKHWWLKQIAEGESPVTERLLLFWQNYFSTQITSLPSPKLSWQQQLVLRQHLVGNYRHLLRDMNKDPALLWYLDNHLNNKKKPNENYARELLELYTLGEGHFSEQDVKNLARAMTGAGVDRTSWLYAFNQKQHDQDEKSFLGVTGKLAPDDIIDIILRQKRAAEYLVERLWLDFVSPTIDKAAIEQLAENFRQSDYEIRPLLGEIFNHPSFWDKKNRLVLVKSPVELIVQAHLESGAKFDSYPKAVKALTEMGQDLFEPPDVGGWPQGDEWINSVRLGKRHRYLFGVDESLQAARREINYQLK